MKQLLQSLATGASSLPDLPAPALSRGQLLIASSCSLVSAGTERMLVEFGKANWVDKARKQPDKVHDVLNKVRTDGLLPTVESVRSKLDEPLPLGYCNVGKVVAIGPDVTGFKIGDRVASNTPVLACAVGYIQGKIDEAVAKMDGRAHIPVEDLALNKLG